MQLQNFCIFFTFYKVVLEKTWFFSIAISASIFPPTATASATATVAEVFPPTATASATA